MPIYNYQCQYCGEVFEELTDDLNKRIAFCPLCEEEGIAAKGTKVMSIPNFKIHGFSEANGYSSKRSEE